MVIKSIMVLKKWSRICYLVSILSVVFACTDEWGTNDKTNNIRLEQESSEEFNFPVLTENASIAGIPVPDGTQIEKVDNATIKISLPKGYYFANVSGRLLELTPDGSYTCTCSGSNGCNVFYVKGNYGCSHGSCTGSCTGNFSNRKAIKIDKENIFIIDHEDILAPATDAEFETLPYIPEKLILSLENEFKSYARSLYGDKFVEVLNYVDKKNSGKSDINDIMLVKMKMYGFKFIYSVNTTMLKPEIMKSNKFLALDYEGGGHSCNCDSGQSGCTADTSWGVKYCDGGACTKCTMTVN